MFVVPLVALPMLIVVVLPVVPPVPILSVLVNAPVSAAVLMLVVLAAPVPVYPTVNAVTLANAPNVALASNDVVNVGAVSNTILPVPVAPVAVTPSSVGCPLNTTLPVPLGVSVMLPLTPCAIVMVPELVPALVFNNKL